VGVVVESGDGTEQYCHDYPPLPTSDRFWPEQVRTLGVGDLSVGAERPDDPEAICVPLG
jgi:hypothetical protein